MRRLAWAPPPSRTWQQTLAGRRPPPALPRTSALLTLPVTVCITAPMYLAGTIGASRWAPSGGTFMNQPIPQLFDHIAPRLFAPLASKIHRLYWEILLIVYRLHNEAGVEEIGKETVLNRVEEHLRDRE